MLTINGKNNNFILTLRSMKMETPKKHNAQDTSNTLKRALQNESFIKAMKVMLQAHKNAIKNGLFDL